MLKRSLVAGSLTLILVFSAVPIRPVLGVLMTPEEVAMLEASSQDVENSQAKSRGNSFVRVLKAPFKAIGRVFGIGGKDDNKPQRLSKKDVKKFETTASTRIVDARTTGFESAPVAQTTEGAASADANLAPATDNLERGRALLDSGNLNDAIAVLSTAVSTDPTLHQAYNLLGVAYEAKGMRDRAFESFAKALNADKNNPEYYNNLGYLYFKNGDYDKAARYLKRAVNLAPKVQRYWNNLGLVQSQRGKFDDAYDCFVKAVGEYEGHMNVANRSQAMGYDKTAIKHLEQARAMRSTAEILLRLAVLYKRTGNDELAAEANAALVAARSQANVTK